MDERVDDSTDENHTPISLTNLGFESTKKRMQRLVEAQQYRGAATNKQRSQLIVVVTCVLFAAWLAFFVLPGTGIDEMPGDKYARPSGSAFFQPVGRPTQRPTLASPPPHLPRDTNVVLPESIDVLPPWGYNSDRNVPRWRAIAASIKTDLNEGTSPADFTLVDYGADQGYFSVSAAHAFPQAFVIAVEGGGKGGAIWCSGKKCPDVHSIQEEAIANNSISDERISLCKTFVSPETFAQLKQSRQVHTYQFILSVFHWFPMNNRREFEEAVVDLFSNARTTFIELPTIGDNSALIRKQVRYEYWSKWYDGRSDVGAILRDAIRARGMQATVTKIASLPWVKWARVVYRVDVHGGVTREGHEAAASAGVGGASLQDGGGAATVDPFSGFSYSCETHRRIYKCGLRSKHQQCPVSRR
jgi:hypothetical protein